MYPKTGRALTVKFAPAALPFQMTGPKPTVNSSTGTLKARKAKKWPLS